MEKLHLCCVSRFGILHEAKNIFSKSGLKTLSFVHSYLNYGNIVWRSTTRTKVKKLASKQRQAIRVIYAAEYRSEEMEEMKVLDISKLNIYQVLTVIAGSYSENCIALVF